MRLHDKKLFADKEKLGFMLYLRYQGLALTTLAAFFGCDISSIRFQCDKFHVKPHGDVYTFERIINQILPNIKPASYKLINGEKINIGKSYEEYIKEGKKLSPFYKQNNRIKYPYEYPFRRQQKTGGFGSFEY